jgi:hypothetical protein
MNSIVKILQMIDENFLLNGVGSGGGADELSGDFLDGFWMQERGVVK